MEHRQEATHAPISEEMGSEPDTAMKLTGKESDAAKKSIKMAEMRNNGFNLMNTRSANSIRASEIDGF